MPSSGPEDLNLYYSSPQDPGLVCFQSIFSCVCLVWVFWCCFVVVSHLHHDGVLPSELFQVTRNSFQAEWSGANDVVFSVDMGLAVD